MALLPVAVHLNLVLQLLVVVPDPQLHPLHLVAVVPLSRLQPRMLKPQVLPVVEAVSLVGQLLKSQLQQEILLEIVLLASPTQCAISIFHHHSTILTNW